jgi:hypothetical protein
MLKAGVAVEVEAVAGAVAARALEEQQARAPEALLPAPPSDLRMQQGRQAPAPPEQAAKALAACPRARPMPAD